MKSRLLHILAIAALCIAPSFLSSCGKKNVISEAKEKLEQQLLEQARLERERLEQETLEQQQREQQEREAQRLEQEQLEQQKREQQRLADEKQALEQQRTQARASAVGRELGNFTTPKGRTYEQAVIKQVDAIGITVMHSAGSSRIPFDDLPPEMQEEFLYSSKEQQRAVEDERQHRQRYLAELRAHNAATQPQQPDTKTKSASTGNDREMILDTISRKKAQLQSVNAQIADLQNQIAADQAKIWRAHAYGRIGVSRAPIYREQLEKLRAQQLALNQQITTLKGMLGR